MELRHLRYFVAVAEELNFRRAAERLGIKQPPLSSQIHQLEKEIGAPLFRRLTRGVELTDAGKLLLHEARLILGQVEHAKAGVRRRARGETGKLVIGSAGATYFCRTIPEILREYRKRFPDVVVSPEASNTMVLSARLRLGQIDIAFIWGPIPDSDRLTKQPLAEEEFVMLVPSSHRLATNSPAPLAAIAKEPLIRAPRALNPYVYDIVTQACVDAGFEPIPGPEAPQMVSILPLVAAGLGVAVVPHSTSRISIEGVKPVAISSEAPRVELCLVRRRDERSQAVLNFVMVAREVSRDRPVRRVS